MEVEAITPIHDESEEDGTTVEISSNNEEEIHEAATESNLENAESSESPIEIPSTEVEESVKNTPKVTQQAEALKAALRRAQANQKTGKNPQQNRQNPQNKKSPAVDDRRRTMLLGKKATRTIKADNGDIIVENGAEITEEVLQKAKLANKYIELSMNYSH